MNRMVFAFIVLALASIACGSSTSKTADDYLKEYGGNRDIYIKILALESCSDLQSEFNTASENNSLNEPGTTLYKATIGYMKAADDRMKELSCYKETNSSPTQIEIPQLQVVYTPTIYLLPIQSVPRLTQAQIQAASDKLIGRLQNGTLEERRQILRGILAEVRAERVGKQIFALVTYYYPFTGESPPFDQAPKDGTMLPISPAPLGAQLHRQLFSYPAEEKARSR